MIWTRIRISPSHLGGLPGSVAPYMTYCLVRKCGFDCQQLPPHGNCLVNTYKELIVRTPCGCNALNRCKKHKVLIVEDEIWKGTKDSIAKLCTMGNQHIGLFLDLQLVGLKLFMYFNISVAMVFILDPQRELGDRLHSVNIDMISDNHLKQLVISCFGFLSLLYTGCLEQKWQTME